MQSRFLPWFIFLLTAANSLPAAAEDLEQCFRDLANDAVVMNISAHPDDEDGATLAYYRKKLGAKTYSILFTRGEGGQNEIGPELYEELAVIRTEETLRAGEILGAHVEFLNFSDFGYSRTATEAFRMWGGRREVLRRLVYFIRKYRPDILFTNHGTGGGHGHHQAVAVTAIAAFDAAADPAEFPEQLSSGGLSPWQPAKLYTRLFPSTGGKPDVTNSVEQVHEPSGETYLEIASRALSMHKSQGMESVNLARVTGGASLYRLTRTNSAYAQDTSGFFGGMSFASEMDADTLRVIREAIDNLVPGMAVDETVRQCSDILTSIRERMQRKSGSRSGRLLHRWEEELETLVLASSGIDLRIVPDDSIVVAGQKVLLQVSMMSDKAKVQLNGIALQPAPGWSQSDAPEAVRGPIPLWQVHLVPGPSAVRTLPKLTQQYRPIEAEHTTGVRLDLTIDGNLVSVHRPVAVDVAPDIEFSVTPRAAWVPLERSSTGIDFDFRIVNRFAHKTAGSIEVEPPEGWRGSAGSYLVNGEDGIATGRVTVIPNLNSIVNEGFVRFRAGTTVDSARVRLFDVKVAPGVKLGIIKSYDNTLETVAQNLGVPFKLLDREDLQSGDLRQYTSIVLDIRTYAVREDVLEFNNRLLDYAREGGNLVVFYQKTQDWKSEYAPYPLKLTRNRITDEEAPVTLLQPDHPLLESPNPIGMEDWTGWVQERGVYFPGEASTEYLRILSSNDPDERPLDTGLLVAKTGLGSYIYTSYVWYRQMKEAHPGSIRFFTNMISYTGSGQ